ncbi:transposase (plasmid) [Borreliella japonica]|uniref:transposase n=1 Tax=Borreliella japonica TaxID=34095 RepID=UPI003430D562
MCYLYKRTLNQFNHDKDHIYLLLEFNFNIKLSKFINNLRTVDFRLIGKNIPLI